MSIGFIFLALLVVAAFATGSIQWRISRSRSVLQQWGTKMDLKFSKVNTVCFLEVHFF